MRKSGIFRADFRFHELFEGISGLTEIYCSVALNRLVFEFFMRKFNQIYGRLAKYAWNPSPLFIYHTPSPRLSTTLFIAHFSVEFASVIR